MTSACLQEWQLQRGVVATYIYLPTVREGIGRRLNSQSCCPALLESLKASALHQEVFRGPGGAVFAELRGTDQR
jgi:hypothetical protein